MNNAFIFWIIYIYIYGVIVGYPELKTRAGSVSVVCISQHICVIFMPVCAVSMCSSWGAANNPCGGVPPLKCHIKVRG